MKRLVLRCKGMVVQGMMTPTRGANQPLYTTTIPLTGHCAPSRLHNDNDSQSQERAIRRQRRDLSPQYGSYSDTCVHEERILSYEMVLARANQSLSLCGTRSCLKRPMKDITRRSSFKIEYKAEKWPKWPPCQEARINERGDIHWCVFLEDVETQLHIFSSIHIYVSEGFGHSTVTKHQEGARLVCET